jgi:hypothetical protein
MDSLVLPRRVHSQPEGPQVAAAVVSHDSMRLLPGRRGLHCEQGQHMRVEAVD